MAVTIYTLDVMTRHLFLTFGFGCGFHPHGSPHIGESLRSADPSYDRHMCFAFLLFAMAGVGSRSRNLDAFQFLIFKVSMLEILIVLYAHVFFVTWKLSESAAYRGSGVWILSRVCGLAGCI